jgi:hypothetical protein
MEPKITFSFSLAEANLVLAALGQRPYAEVADLMQKIKAEGEAQLVAAQTAPAPASEEIK